MSKKAVVISSSPRKGGNSDILADEFAKGARDAGHSVEKINVRELNMKFCSGCMYCQSAKKCVQPDDMNGLYPTVRDCDVIVFASPVYYYAVSGQLKTFLDRLNPLYTADNKFTEVYLLSSSAEDDEKAMDGSVSDIEGWISCFDGVTLKGVLRATGVSERGDVMNTSYVIRAYEMGKNI